MADTASGLGLAHTHTHTGREEEREYCRALLRLLSRTVLLLFLPYLEQKFSRSFVLRLSGFFSAEMGMRDSVDWQVGSRRWGGILL